MFLFLAESTSKALNQTTQTNETMASFFLLIVVTIIFFGTIWFQQKMRDKKQKALYDSIKVGDIVCTIGGITGVVKKIKDDEFKIEVIKNQEPITIKKWGIAEKIK